MTVPPLDQWEQHDTCAFHWGQKTYVSVGEADGRILWSIRQALNPGMLRMLAHGYADTPARAHELLRLTFSIIADPGIVESHRALEADLGLRPDTLLLPGTMPDEAARIDPEAIAAWQAAKP